MVAENNCVPVYRCKQCFKYHLTIESFEKHRCSREESDSESESENDATVFAIPSQKDETTESDQVEMVPGKINAEPNMEQQLFYYENLLRPCNSSISIPTSSKPGATGCDRSGDLNPSNEVQNCPTVPTGEKNTPNTCAGEEDTLHSSGLEEDVSNVFTRDENNSTYSARVESILNVWAVEKVNLSVSAGEENNCNPTVSSREENRDISCLLENGFNASNNGCSNSTPFHQVERTQRPNVEYLYEKIKSDPRTCRARRRGNMEIPKDTSIEKPVKMKTEVIEEVFLLRSDENDVIDTDDVRGDFSTDDVMPKRVAGSTSTSAPQGRTTRTRNVHSFKKDLKIGIEKPFMKESVRLQTRTQEPEKPEMDTKISEESSSGIDPDLPMTSNDPDEQPPDIKRIKMEPKRRSTSGRGRKVTICAFCSLPLDESVDPNTQKEGAVLTPVSCPECKITFCDLKIFIRHYYREKRYACSACKIVLKSKEAIIQHFRRHTGMPVWTLLTPKLEKKNPKESVCFSSQIIPSDLISESSLAPLFLTNVIPKSEGARGKRTSKLRHSPANRTSTIESTGKLRPLRHRSPIIREKMLLQQKGYRRAVSERLTELEVQNQGWPALRALPPTGERKTRNSTRSRTTTSM